MDVLKKNLLKILVCIMAIVNTIIILNSSVSKSIIIVTTVIILLLITKVLQEATNTSIDFKRSKLLMMLTNLVSIIMYSLLFIFCLSLLAMFAGYISKKLDGIYGIDQKVWLGFVGTCLSSILGVVGGYFGAKVHITQLVNKKEEGK